MPKLAWRRHLYLSSWQESGEWLQILYRYENFNKIIIWLIFDINQYLVIDSYNHLIVDRNECEEWNFCDQKCENTDGSFKCTCIEGYELEDRTYCKAKLSYPKMKIFFTHTDTIYTMDSRGNKRNAIANATAASGLDFHYKRRLLFFTDTEKRKVYQMQLDESGKKAINKRDYR